MPAEERAKRQLDHTIRSLENAVEAVADDAVATRLAVRKQVRAHPGSSIAVALGLGLVLGAILGRATS